MKFEIIPDEQTPEIIQIDSNNSNYEEDVRNYIELHRSELEAFFKFASTQTNAVGLATNQTALNGTRLALRAFAIMDLNNKLWRLIIYPIINDYIGIKELKSEGCLTWKGRKIIAERYRAINVNYFDMDGNRYTGEIYKGFEAQIWQHEINHLNGVFENVVDIFEPDPKPINVGRNELCPCGSGKKYKKCCLLWEKDS